MADLDLVHCLEHQEAEERQEEEERQDMLDVAAGNKPLHWSAVVEHVPAELASLASPRAARRISAETLAWSASPSAESYALPKLATSFLLIVMVALSLSVFTLLSM